MLFMGNVLLMKHFCALPGGLGLLNVIPNNVHWERGVFSAPIGKQLPYLA